ncbi:uncharacterized protein LOC117181875 [Belonocnema kinseyi]|uniref:uncharacterized protein LOC117181875 n=1 Tax=Belonocnema kinseyi TaxID=2817044 RepID=UPI00143DE9B7|nr:uncharacterized protein LOC117181875 [Belonocnema kinseyi]
MFKVQNQSEKRMSQLPGWLWPNSNILPPVYKRIWGAVREEKTRPGANLGEVLVDTNKIFPLLLTSQLTTEVLGYIWSLANQKYAGQLTEQELYIVLALVALAQASYPFNSLEVLHLVRVPPVPNLNIALLDNYTVIPGKKEPKPQDAKVHSVFENPSNSVSHSNFIPNSSSTSNLNSFSNSRSGIRTSSVVTSSSADNLFNSTHETRSEKKNSPSNCGFGVNFPVESRQGLKNHSSNDSSDDFSDFQSAPLPAIPTIPMWDTKQGSAIGSRLANHNLGVKKPGEKLKKTSAKSNSHLVQGNQGSQANIGRNSGINVGASKEMQLTDGGILMNSGHSSGYRNSLGDGNLERLTELFPKCSLKNQSKTVILRDTIIRNDPPKSIEVTPKEFQTLEKIPGNEGELLSKHSAESAQDLMNLQQTEDKYSALRVLVEEPVTAFSKTNLEVEDPLPADDFGDFVSAEQSIAPDLDTLGTETNMDLFSEFDFKTDSFLSSEIKTETSLVQEISEAFDALGFEEFRDHQTLGSKFEAQLDTDKVVQKEDCISVNSIELGNGVPGVLTRSGSVPSLDLKSFLSPSQEDESTVENMHQTIYWEWKQYMESCVLLLQVAANIFSNISTEAVLREVLATAQGYNFLCNLAEVAAVCRRVNFSHKEMDINIMGFDDLLMEIDRIWAEMEPFYTNIPIVTELPVWPLHQNENVTCALCLTVIMSGKVSHNENNYHVTCANLWLNCVNSNLPVLRNPSFQSHSTVFNSTNQIEK